MASRARTIGFLGALLALALTVPLAEAATTLPGAGPLASVPGDASCGALLARNDAPPDIATPSAIRPTVLDVLANDCEGSASSTRPLTITSVTQGSHGSVTTDGQTVVYNPSGCSTGLDTFKYTITDGVTSSTGSVIFNIERPAASPLTDAPQLSFRTGSTVGKTIPMRLSWCGVPASGASVKSYRVAQGTNGGATFPSLIASATTSTHSTRKLAINTSYAWRVRTTDTKGRAGYWVASLTSRIRRYQENSSAIKYSSGWKTGSTSKFYGGKSRFTTKSGATATIHVTNVRAFAIVATEASSRGKFYVYIDGSRRGPYTQKASKTGYRRVVYSAGLSSGAGVSHTITIKSASRSRIDIDAILTLSGKKDQAISFSTPAPTSAIVGGTPDSVAATTTSGLPLTLSVTSGSWSACSLSGGVISYHGRGTCSVVATQSGDPTWNAATATQAFAVAGLPQVITFDPLADTVYGGPDVTVAATSDNSDLDVAFGSSTPAVCTVSGTTVSIVAAGTCTIVASQPGDATRAAADPVSRSFTVATVPLTVTGVTAADRAYDGTVTAQLDLAGAQLVGVLGTDDVTLVTAAASGAFDDANAAAGKTVHVSGLTLSGAKAANYALTQPATTASISPASQTITFTSSAPVGPVKDGPTYTPTATATSGLAVALTVDSISSGVCDITGGVVSFTGAGTCVVNADQAGDANHARPIRKVQSMTVAATGSTPQTIDFTQPARRHVWRCAGEPRRDRDQRPRRDVRLAGQRRLHRLGDHGRHRRRRLMPDHRLPGRRSDLRRGTRGHPHVRGRHAADHRHRDRGDQGV